MTDKEFFEKSLEVSTEFDRFILGHEAIAAKIPNNALIIFEIEDNPEFTVKSNQIALSHKETNQPIVRVKIKRLLPPLETRLLEPRFDFSAA